MPIPPPQGLGAIDALVHAGWTRTDRKRDRALPIVVLLGAPGSGKTHALAHFARATRFQPSAQMDFADSGPHRPYEIAVQIVFHLARKYRDLKRLRFPRLLLGLVAMGSTLSGTNPDQAQEQLREALRAARRRQIDAAQWASWLDAGAATVGLPRLPATEQVVTLLARAYEYTRVNTILNRSLGWYARSNALSAHSAVDELIELNRRARGTAMADLAFVDQLLCEAFLADLRAAYARHPTDQNCLVLLDNIDHPGRTVTGFLELIARLRTEHAAAQPLSYDPLLIVATSATTQAVPGPSDGRPGDPYIRPADDASWDDWQPRPDIPPVNWWYPVRLRDFTETEVARISGIHEEEIAARTNRPLQRRLHGNAPLVHRLTYGHPWSVRQLHGAIGGLLADGGPAHSPQSLHGLMERRVPYAGEGADIEEGLPLATVVRGYLLGGLSEDQRAAAVKLSAARTPSAAVNAGLLVDLPELARDTVMVELRHRLWLFDPVPEDANTRGGLAPHGYLAPAATETRPVLHPWLRLLLLEELANGPGGGDADWQQAHRDLYLWHEQHGRRLDALYHLLALDRVDDVVADFAESFRRTDTAADAQKWLSDLYRVTAAPMRRGQLSDGRASHNASALARAHAPQQYADHQLGRPLAELTAALWLAADPRNRLPVGRPELNYLVGAMFRHLAMPSGDADTLLDEAARYSL